MTIYLISLLATALIIAITIALMYRSMYRREAMWNRYLLISCYRQRVEELDDERVVKIWLN